MLLQWFLVHIKTGRNRWLTLKNAFVCRLLKCKLPVPSLDLSVIGVFIHFNRGYCTVGVRWGFFFFFFWENLTAFLLTTSDRKYSYNFATTVISQDDHLTAGAWAACGLILRIIQLNVIDPSPGKWLVTIPRPHYTRHGKGCHNSYCAVWWAGRVISFRYNWRKGKGNQMHETISFSKTRLNAHFRSVATTLRKKKKGKLVIQTIPDLFINCCLMYRHYRSLAVT